MKEELVFSPLSGRAVPMAEVPDPVFADNIIGHGVAVLPADSAVVAPLDGEITAVTRTNHAFCIKSDKGLELLVHLGIDTVKLGGRGFTRHVEKGQRVKKGDKVMDFDLQFFLDEGVNIISPVIVVASEDAPACVPHLGEVRAGESVLLTCQRDR